VSVSAPRPVEQMGPVRRRIAGWWRSRQRWRDAERAAAREARLWLRPLVSDYRPPYGGGR